MILVSGVRRSLLRYHHCSVRWFAWLTAWQIEKFCKRATYAQFDLAATVQGNNLDAIDEGTHDLPSPRGVPVLGRKTVQPVTRLLSCVSFDGRRMEFHNVVGLRKSCHFRRKCLLLALQFDQFRLHAGCGNAFGNGIDDVGYVAVKIMHALACFMPLAGASFRSRLCSERYSFKNSAMISGAGRRFSIPSSTRRSSSANAVRAIVVACAFLTMRRTGKLVLMV